MVLSRCRVFRELYWTQVTVAELSMLPAQLELLSTRFLAESSGIRARRNSLRVWTQSHRHVIPLYAEADVTGRSHLALCAGAANSRICFARLRLSRFGRISHQSDYFTTLTFILSCEVPYKPSQIRSRLRVRMAS